MNKSFRNHRPGGFWSSTAQRPRSTQDYRDEYLVHNEIRRDEKSALQAPSVVSPSQIANSDLVANRKLLQIVLTEGSFEERASLRRAFTTPDAIAHNQDLMLPHLTVGLEGDKTARAAYEAGRVIIPENLPTWAKSAWDNEGGAAWRKLNLHGKRFSQYARKLHASVDEKYKNIVVAAFDPDQECKEGEPVDHRSAFLTFAIGAEILARAEAISNGRFSREQCKHYCNLEIRQGLRALGSPTLIGAFVRSVASEEIHLLLAVFIVEDMCVSENLPFNDGVKKALLRTAQRSLWSLSKETDFRTLKKAVEVYRKEGLEGDGLEAAIEKIATDSIARSAFVSEHIRQRKVRPLDSRSKRRKLDEPAVKTRTPEEIERETRHRHQIVRSAIQATLAAYQDNIPDPCRTSRSLASLVGQSKKDLFEVLRQLQKGVDPEQLILRLRAERPLSVLNGKAPRFHQPQTKEPAQRTVPDKEKKEPSRVIYAPEAQATLVDGALRLIVEDSLQKLVETPEFADKRKIRGTTDVWELRLLSEKYRVYYFHRGDNTVVVLKVGKKDDQKRDVESLQYLRDREKALVAG